MIKLERCISSHHKNDDKAEYEANYRWKSVAILELKPWHLCFKLVSFQQLCPKLLTPSLLVLFSNLHCVSAGVLIITYNLLIHYL